MKSPGGRSTHSYNREVKGAAGRQLGKLLASAPGVPGLGRCSRGFRESGHECPLAVTCLLALPAARSAHSWSTQQPPPLLFPRARSQLEDPWRLLPIQALVDIGMKDMKA